MKNLILKNQSRIRAIIKRMTGSYNEDIEQEVYIKAWENMSRYEEQGKLSAWLCVITTNLCRDYFRGSFFRSSQKSVDAQDMALADETVRNQEEITDIHQRQKLILKAVDALPSKMREVINLYEFEEMNYDEIAVRLNISVGTVKSRLFNARQILSQKLAYLKGDK